MARGVADHSAFRVERWGRSRRLHRTLDAMLRLSFGTEGAARAVVARINAIHDRVHGRLPESAGAFPAPPLRAAPAWSEALARDRAALFARVLAADPAGRLERTIEHGMFGPLNWRETLLFLRLHDLDHADQLRKIAAALA
ncbi:MAG: DUF2236 domain-containing protein [Candidatus Rokubacteria bacterium]|nr:DUF2236 domain-containing protein [Candidatus Rokubacteria bacterium]